MSVHAKGRDWTWTFGGRAMPARWALFSGAYSFVLNALAVWAFVALLGGALTLPQVVGATGLLYLVGSPIEVTFR